MKERREGSERWTNERRKRAEDRRDQEGEKDHVRMCDTGERETERMLEAIFRWRGGERRMGSRRRRGERGEKKGVKNVGAEETGGKNRAVSTEAAGVCREGRKGGR